MNALLPCVTQRDQVHQQETLVSSLQQHLKKVTEVQAAKQHQLGREGGNLVQENAKLKDSNARLAEELWRMKKRNKKLEEVRELQLFIVKFLGDNDRVGSAK